jgi:hypothetical protein
MQLSIEASHIAEPTPAEVMQDAKTTPKPATIKPTQSVSSPRVAAHDLEVTKAPLPRGASSVLPHLHKQFHVATDLGGQSSSIREKAAASKSVNTPSAATAASPLDPAPDGGTASTCSTRNLGVEEESASSSESQAEALERESALVGSIVALWSSQHKKGSFLRKTRDDLASLRRSLAQGLHDYKKLLARTGRGGKWTEFLRQNNIPRASADRYVKRWERELAPMPESSSSDAFKVPTKEEIAGLIKKLKPRLIGVLTTPDSVAQFMAELAVALKPNESAN